MFSLTITKFMFGNFRAKANLPKLRSCPKRPFGQWLGSNSSAYWEVLDGIHWSNLMSTVQLLALPMPSPGNVRD